MGLSAKQIFEVGSRLREHKLFSQLFDSLDISYRGWKESLFYFLKCKCSTSHSIIFEVSRMMQFSCCSCGIAQQQGNSWVHCIKAVKPELTHEKIILAAEELI